MHKRRLFNFVVVGGLGFVFEATIIQILFSVFGWDPVWARSISFPLAVTFTWVLNKNWTYYRENNKVPNRRYGLYMATQIVGALINVSVFALMANLYPGLAAYPVFLLAIGAGVALFFTYTVSTYFVFAEVDAR